MAWNRTGTGPTVKSWNRRSLSAISFTWAARLCMCVYLFVWSRAIPLVILSIQQFLNFWKRVMDRRTDQWTNGRTDGRTDPLIEMRGRHFPPPLPSPLSIPRVTFLHSTHQFSANALLIKGSWKGKSYLKIFSDLTKHQINVIDGRARSLTWNRKSIRLHQTMM